jgi:GntR family transcriptional regulator
MGEHGVVRGTVRQAIETLRTEGLVVTIRGRGTYVAPK